jgi:transcriptional regulator with XRE-family HTH domain
MRKMNRRLKARIFEVFGTQGDFAQEIGEDETLVSKIICGRRILSLEKQKKWAKALGRKPQEIFCEDT